MDKVKKFMGNLSLRASFVLYVAVFGVLALVLITPTIFLCRAVSENIQTRNTNGEGTYYLLTPDGEKMEIPGGDVSIWEDKALGTHGDRIRLAVCNAVAILCVPVYSMICLIAASVLFYRNKLKKPFEILRCAQQRIAGNDLDFTVEYESGDEMGQLTESFEKMRSALLEGNRKLWRQMEQRKALNAAFAHDLRTPLTVLKGYSEILICDGEDQRILNTAASMRRQINRLERYVETMSSLQKMEDAEPQYQSVRPEDFMAASRQMAEVICEKEGRELDFTAWSQCRLEGKQDNVMLCLDQDMVLEVLENLTANAARFAESAVKLEICIRNNSLSVIVEDDGSGFTQEALKRGAEPYYSGDGDRSSHFGLGLYIGKMFCRHHGGDLILENTGKGARVTALFQYGAAAGRL